MGHPVALLRFQALGPGHPPRQQNRRLEWAARGTQLCRTQLQPPELEQRQLWATRRKPESSTCLACLEAYNWYALRTVVLHPCSPDRRNNDIRLCLTAPLKPTEGLNGPPAALLQLAALIR